MTDRAARQLQIARDPGSGFSLREKFECTLFALGERTTSSRARGDTVRLLHGADYSSEMAIEGRVFVRIRYRLSSR